MVLILPLQWLIAMVLAAAVHELCHLICLKLCGISVYGIHVGLHGAAIQTAIVSPAQELLCAAAGPLGSFLCLIFARFFPLLALCAFWQGIYNLLPLYPFDGGRMLHSLAELTAPSHTDMICRFVTRCTIAGIFLTCVFLYFRTFKLLFLILSGYFLLTTVLSRKTPCKEGRY